MGLSKGIAAAVALLQLVALVFLILATISVPVAQTFYLGKAGDFTYGVFGYCDLGSGCLSATFPWVPSSVDDSVNNWSMSTSARDSLAKILIIAPIAAGICLIAFALSIGAMFGLHTVAIIAIVATVLGFLTSTIVCIVTILLFNPNVGWTGWILVGSAAAMLISIPLLVLGIKFGEYEGINDSSSTLNDGFDNYADVGRGGNDLTTFEETKFGYLPPTTTAKYNDSESSNSSYRPLNSNNLNNNNNNGQANSNNRFNPNDTVNSNNSIYNSNPQRAYDFTNPNPNKHSEVSGGAGATGSSGSYFNDDGVSIVDGPNIPVSAHRNMAPQVVAATPTIQNNLRAGATAEVPYPVSTFGGNTPDTRIHKYNPTVFEHHPEVEGHKPFTEMDENDSQIHHNQDILDSDNESDFTSVSQRAPNPQYYGAPPPPPPHQQQYSSQQYNQFPSSPQPPPPPPGNHYIQHPNQQLPMQQPMQQPMQHPMQQPMQHPMQQPMQQQMLQPVQQQQFFNPSRGPTISDNALSNNPDFAIGGSGGFAKKPLRLPMGPSHSQSPYSLARTQRPGQGNQAGARANIPRGDGPYGFR